MPERSVPNPDDVKTRLSPALRTVAALISIVVLLSAAGGGVASAITSPPTWFLLGFEVVTLSAAVFGVLLGLGWFASAPGLALLCIAGAIGASAFLGYVGAGQELMGVGLKPFLLARLACAAGLAGVGGLAVLMRRPKASLPKLAAGLVCAATLIVASAGAWMAVPRVSVMSEIVLAVAGLLVFSLLLGLLAASVHFFVGAFAACDVDQLPPGEVP
ncbi:MAG: hypothetical protein ACK4WH_05545 [Phycisphaerales bacterium]